MMKQVEFEQLLSRCCDCISQGFEHWETPAFYLQFSAGFEVEGIFDEDVQRLPLGRLPEMPSMPTPDGHEPVLLYGHCGQVPVLVAQGHRHLFEGMGVDPCIIPLCAAWKLGVRQLIFVDPAISLIPELKVGTWTVLTDFINGHRLSPLDGLMSMLPVPFPDMTHALSQRLNAELVNCLARISVSPRLCVYQSLPGAHFCTPAEATAARAAQADVVGHDMVMEIIMGHALGCDVSALALIAEMAPREGGRPLLRRTMLENCRYCSEDLVRGLRLAIQELSVSRGPMGMASLPEATAEEHLFQDFKRPSGSEPALRKYLRRKQDVDATLPSTMQE